METCHQETLQVLLLAGPDHQQAHYPTCILCYKQRSSHTGLSSMGTLSMSQGQPLPPQALLHQLTLSPPLYSSPRRNTSSTRHQRSFTRSWKRS